MNTNIYRLPPDQYLKWRYAHPDPQAAKLLDAQAVEVSIFLTVLWMKQYYGRKRKLNRGPGSKCANSCGEIE